MLDALKDLKQIPDSDINTALTILKNRIGKLDNKQLDTLVQNAVKYPPRVRALLGALLAEMNMATKVDIEMLRDSLNPLTAFKLGLDTDQLPSAIKWNIR